MNPAGACHMLDMIWPGVYLTCYGICDSIPSPSLFLNEIKQIAMSDSPDNDADLQIVADSFRVVSDSSAWDKLVLSWDNKVALAGYGQNLLKNEQALQAHYSVVSNLLRKIGLPTAQDPIDSKVAAVKEPAMVVSSTHRVVAVNAAGRETFGVAQGQSATLGWLSPGDRDAFRDCISAPRQMPNHHYRIFQTLSADSEPGFAEVYPIEVPGIDGQFSAVRELAMCWAPRMDNILSEAFALTRAEVDIARLLFLHADVDRIARTRSVGAGTVRLQLSQIFVKTETRSQVELIRLLVLLSSRLSDKVKNEPLIWSDPFEREKILKRKDGRRLAYSWLGDPAGTPALFLPGIANGYLYPDDFAATLKRRGVKLYVMTRPGSGNSDADPSLTALQDHVGSVLHLCRTLNLQNVTAVGIHAGVIPLTAIAALPDNPFSAIVAIGRFLPPDDKYFLRIAKTPRTLLWLTFNAPWATEIIGQLAWRNILQHGADWYVERAYRDMPFDYATAKQGEISSLLRNACAYTFLQGHQIFFNDMSLRRNDVRDYLPKLKIPFHWLLGAVDVYGTSPIRNGLAPGTRWVYSRMSYSR